MRVIPANAGVILELNDYEDVIIGYPRECGGDPNHPFYYISL